MWVYRLSEGPTRVGVDVEAALATFGVGDSVLGGVALLGCRVAGSPHTLDAVVVLHRGVLLVVGIDLPAPALRLEAAINAPWRVDGTPLTRGDGTINPAADAQRAAWAVTHQLHTMRADLLPVTTVIAVGPHVEHVLQPTVDLHRGTRVLHPTPRTLLSAARELATHERPCSIEQARHIIAALTPNWMAQPSELTAEGFADAGTPDFSHASTMLIPRVISEPRQVSARYSTDSATAAQGHEARVGAAGAVGQGHRKPRALGIAAAGLVAGLMLAGVVVAIASDGGSQPTSEAPRRQTYSVGGVNFAVMGSARDADCIAHSYGDVHVWLTKRPCQTMSRRVLATDPVPRKAAVSLVAVDLPDPVAAEDFKHLVDTPGSGGITDLVRDGHGWPGGPRSFDGAATASARNGSRVDIVQVAWIDQTSNSDDPGLLLLAQQALTLPAEG